MPMISKLHKYIFFFTTNMFLLKCVSCFKSYLNTKLLNMRRMEDSSAVLNSQKYSEHSNMLTPLSAYLHSWKNPNSIMFAMKSGMYYKVKKTQTYILKIKHVQVQPNTNLN